MDGRPQLRSSPPPPRDGLGPQSWQLPAPCAPSSTAPPPPPRSLASIQTPRERRPVPGPASPGRASASAPARPRRGPPRAARRRPDLYRARPFSKTLMSSTTLAPDSARGPPFRAPGSCEARASLTSSPLRHRLLHLSSFGAIIEKRPPPPAPGLGVRSPPACSSCSAFFAVEGTSCNLLPPVIRPRGGPTLRARFSIGPPY